jgi:anti-sigma B factor antagonist
MTIEATSTAKAVILKVTGRMDAESHKEFERACEHWIQQGATHLIVDLEALDYISSAGIGSIVRAGKGLQKKNGAVLLCGVKGLVKEVLEITRLISVFQVFDSAEDAIASIP